MRALIFAASLMGETLSGPAVPLDGDTLLMDGPNGSTLYVRLYGVDALEMGDPWGPQARAVLDDANAGRPVDCRVLAEDIRGRPVALCAVEGPSESLNLSEAVLPPAWAPPTGSTPRPPRPTWRSPNGSTRPRRRRGRRVSGPCADQLARGIAFGNYLEHSAEAYLREHHEARRKIPNRCGASLWRGVDTLEQAGDFEVARTLLALNYPTLLSIEAIRALRDGATELIDTPWGCEIEGLPPE